MALYIAGIGTATPPHSIEQADAAREAAETCPMTDKQRRLLPILYRQAGVRRRRSVLLHPSADGKSIEQSLYRVADGPNDFGPSTRTRMEVYEREAGPLAARACAKALAASDVHPSEITHLVTVSCSGFQSPGCDLHIARELGLSSDIARTHVGFMGCHGALIGLRVARAFTDADPEAKVLLCAVELCSLHHQYVWNPEQVVANALFADGAAAIVGIGRPATAGHNLRILSNGSTIIPETLELMGWRIGDNGFQMNLSARVPEVISASLKCWLEKWLGANDTALGDIGVWAIHPGGPRIIQACAHALELEQDAIRCSLDVLSEYGNMSSPTVLFILERLIAQPSISDRCVLLAFGPGLTIEAALAEPATARMRPRSAREALAKIPESEVGFGYVGSESIVAR